MMNEKEGIRKEIYDAMDRRLQEVWHPAGAKAVALIRVGVYDRVCTRTGNMYLEPDRLGRNLVVPMIDAREDI